MFLCFRPTIGPILSVVIWVDVGENQSIDRLTVWPNDEEMQLTK